MNEQLTLSFTDIDGNVLTYTCTEDGFGFNGSDFLEAVVNFYRQVGYTNSVDIQIHGTMPGVKNRVHSSSHNGVLVYEEREVGGKKTTLEEAGVGVEVPHSARMETDPEYVQKVKYYY